MADIPAIVNYETKFCAENMQPVFNVCYGALDRASTPAEGRTALDVYSKAEAATLSYVNGTFLETSGGTMSGSLNVIAGATGDQAMRASEIAAADNLRVLRAGDTMTGPLEVPAGASGDQVMQASEIAALIETRLKEVWPIGSIYITLGVTNPSTMLPGTTWELIAEGTFLASAGGVDYPLGATGGEAEHILTIDEMPTHRHDTSLKQPVAGGTVSWAPQGMNSTNVTINSSYQGGDQPHENRPPYLAVNMWKRTA